MKKVAPYGSWPSEITTGLMTGGTVGLSEVRLFDGEVYWLESRPQEQGRTVIMRRQDPDNDSGNDSGKGSGRNEELITTDYSCRTRVHEYGGACYLPTSAGVFFVNHQDQQVYRIDASRKVSRLTDQPDCRFADLVFHETAATLIAVSEQHFDDGAEPRNSLVAIDVADGSVSVLHDGQDFYASASVSPDGQQLCWLSWMHPNMPWDGTMLWQAEYKSDSLTDARVVAGGDSESLVQPEWSPDGQLYFVSDKSNWWNLYRLKDGSAESVCPRDAEFGLPQWQFGMTRYGFVDAQSVITSYSHNGFEKLAVIDLATGELQDFDRDHSSFASLRVEAGKVCYIAQSPVEFPSVYVSDVGSGDIGMGDDSEQLICSSATPTIKPGNFSIAQSVTFPTADNQQSHGFFYPPENADYQGPDNALPPLLVMIHGGPTSATSDSLSYKVQYWTSRGFAVLDVNYRGSTGFGRSYRDALKTQWGIADVEDCDYGVRYLIDRELVDAERVAIRGGSAGGYTVLAALAHTQTFKAGTSLYGVSDLTSLATDTHKFESRYLDSLIGPYPQEKAIYEQRSPVNHAESITAPVLFLQGLDDKVVPPSQAEMMLEKLKSNGTAVAYIAFEGEAHGFRKSATICRAFESELWFYGSVFGFEPAEKIAPVEFM